MTGSVRRRTPALVDVGQPQVEAGVLSRVALLQGGRQSEQVPGGGSGAQPSDSVALVGYDEGSSWPVAAKGSVNNNIYNTVIC